MKKLLMMNLMVGLVCGALHGSQDRVDTLVDSICKHILPRSLEASEVEKKGQKAIIQTIVDYCGRYAHTRYSINPHSCRDETLQGVYPSPGGQIIASVGKHKQSGLSTLRFRSTEDGSRYYVAARLNPAGDIHDCSWSPDSRYLFITHHDTCKLIGFYGKEESKAHYTPKSSIIRLRGKQDCDKYLYAALGRFKGQPVVFTAEQSPTEWTSQALQIDSSIDGLALVPDAERIVAIHSKKDQGINTMKPSDNGFERTFFPHITAMDCQSNPPAVACLNGIVEYHLKDCFKQLKAHRSPIDLVTMSRSGNRVATVSNQEGIRIHACESGEQVAHLSGSIPSILQFSPDEHEIASVEGYRLQIFTLTDSCLIQEHTFDHPIKKIVWDDKGLFVARDNSDFELFVDKVP